MAMAAFASVWSRKSVCQFVLILLTLALFSTIASARNQLTLIETDPVTPATLGYWEEFYLRIGYTSDNAIRVRAEAFSGGQRVTEITSGSLLYPSGTGEAFFWLAYTRVQHVDAIQITATDDGGWKTFAQISVPVDLTWTGVRSATSRAKADWVNQALAEESRREKAVFAAHMNRPVPLGGSLLFIAVMWSIPAYFVLQVVLLWRLRDGWRKAIAVPVIPMLAVVAYTIFAYLDGSNLFPLVLIFAAPIALIYLLVILGVRRMDRKPA